MSPTSDFDRSVNKLVNRSQKQLKLSPSSATGRRPKGMTDPVNWLHNNIEINRIELLNATVSGYVTGSVEKKISNWWKCTN